MAATNFQADQNKPENKTTLTAEKCGDVLRDNCNPSPHFTASLLPLAPAQRSITAVSPSRGRGPWEKDAECASQACYRTGLGDYLLTRTFVPSPNLRIGARGGTSYQQEATVPVNPHLHLLGLLSARPLSPTLQSTWPHALQ